ncbi:tetratricopeptide repeat protein [Rhizobium laguerreae]
MRTISCNMERLHGQRYGTRLTLIALCMCDTASERLLQALQGTLAIDPEDLNAMYNIACAYLHMGEHEAGLDLLDQVIPRASAHRFGWTSDPDLDPIRDPPRFKSLVERTIGPL